MNTKIILCLVLLSCGTLVGAQAPRIPSPPSAEQVRVWAGFTNEFTLQRVTEPTNNATKAGWGKLLWDCRYENRKRSLVSFEIVLCEAGTLLGTNHTRAPKLIEEQVAKLRAATNAEPREEIKQAIQIQTLPNGQKAYFTVLGFGPGGTGVGGFTYGRAFDLLVIEDFDAEDDVPPAQKLKHPACPTHALPVVLGKVHAFLTGQ